MTVGPKRVRMTIAGLCLALGLAGAIAEPESPATPPADEAADTGSSSEKLWMRLIPEDTFRPRPPEPRPELPDRVERAFVIPVKEPITSTLVDAIRRKVSLCKGRDAQLVIFEMDSPGGALAAMEEIIRIIQQDLAGIRTVAWVRPEAFSAAAIISLACDEIVLSNDSTIGDAMPILVSPQGGLQKIPEKERGKIESAMRAKIRVLAEQGGYNVALCEAMITITHEVWLIRRRGTVRLALVNAEQWRDRVAGAPGRKIDSERDEAREAEREWEYLATVDGEDELVTMKAREAVRLGFAEHILDSAEELRRRYNVAGELIVLEDTWSEDLVAFLTSPVVTSILLMGGMFLLYMEFQAPGFGVPGALAILCFAILFGSRYLIGLAAWWEVGLFILGVVLIGVEIFVIPGFGIAGISGIICCVVGLVAMVVANAPSELPIPDTALDWRLFERGVLALGAGFVLGVVAMFVGARYLPRIPGARPLVLAPPGREYDGPPVDESSPMSRVQVGDVGTVEGPCRPVGKVRIGEDLLNASSEGDMIPAGAKVRVLRKDSNRLLVEPVQERSET